ncbi:MAG: DUF3822 family protein [Crocinitomicaceae bacterium]
MMINHLAIQVAIDGIHCVVLKNGIATSKSELFFDSSNDVRIKEQLSKEFESNDIYSIEFDEITLSWSSDKTTLVPNTIFSESTPQAIFELCYGKNEVDVDYNRISELSVVNVYEIPDWIKRFFVMKFPRVNIQHEGSMLVRQALNENTFKLKCCIVIYANHFQLIISKHNELIFYSNFDYQSTEDIIYHTTFVLQQKELTNEQGSFELITGISASNETVASIKAGFKRISDLKAITINTPDNFIQKAHQLCV